MQADLNSNPIVFYDGLCALCNGWVKFVLRRDKEAVFRFAALQTEAARVYLEPHAIDPALLNSIVVLDNGKVYQRSAGILRILDHLGYPWKLLGVTKILPTFLRDWAYDFVARIRYRVFGRFNSCPLPPFDMRDRFL